MSGANLVMPGPATAPDRLVATMATHHVTFAAAVPTIWQSAIPHLHRADLGALRRLVSGGGALPVSLSETYLETLGLPSPAPGDDGDQSAGLQCAHPKRRRRTQRARTSRGVDDPRPPTPLCGLRLIGDDGAEVPATVGPPVNSRSPGRLSLARTSVLPQPIPPSPTTAGCAPATSPPSTREVSCASSTAPRT